jgi:GNAT superfamily N-acetyltransferase
VAVAGGHIVGVVEFVQTPYRYHPQKFGVDAYLHPAHQGRGLGTRLYDHLVSALQPFDPWIIRNALREDLTRGLTFLAHRGWQEAQRTWESFLDLRTVDLAPHRPVLERVLGEGIALRPLEDLAGDPARDRKLYDLTWEIRQDMPDLDEPNQESFEAFQKDHLGHPDLLPGGFLVAVDGDTYAGFIGHQRMRTDPARLKISTLGVGRAYRGRGVAHALKVQGILVAQAHGYQTLRTTNESRNHAVLSINERLGFRRAPAWIHLIKDFRAG